MRASGDQLRQIAELVDAGTIRTVVGATFPFDQTPQALASLSRGGAPRQIRHHHPLTQPPAPHRQPPPTKDTLPVSPMGCSRRSSSRGAIPVTLAT
ncbi:zinc-binding dehydrogenase [Microbacterium caowuchunii]|uniref:zinc-binding dehydrogenase n=1 Tax=Microbacterium caowuchunii TaxID=2614638 RepID=UPI00124911E1|nr:zinc-binding dehydrogenase [Microbacterium caowuchunii]QEW01470.1 zinc-binding dehydrogenase [Microbacterium caowuchunii]